MSRCPSGRRQGVPIPAAKHWRTPDLGSRRRLKGLQCPAPGLGEATLSGLGSTGEACVKPTATRYAVFFSFYSRASWTKINMLELGFVWGKSVKVRRSEWSQGAGVWSEWLNELKRKPCGFRHHSPQICLNYRVHTSSRFRNKSCSIHQVYGPAGLWSHAARSDRHLTIPFSSRRNGFRRCIFLCSRRAPGARAHRRIDRPYRQVIEAGKPRLLSSICISSRGHWIRANLLS